MTATKQILIVCDTPDCMERITMNGGRAYESRKIARDEFGWTLKNELDICPLHNLL